MPGRLEDLADQEGGRRLAVGAGDPDHPQLARSGRRRTRAASGAIAARASATTTCGTAELERALDDQRRRARLDRRARELVPVALLARHAEEQRPRPDLAAVVGELGDLDVPASPTIRARDRGRRDELVRASSPRF